MHLPTYNCTPTHLHLHTPALLAPVVLATLAELLTHCYLTVNYLIHTKKIKHMIGL
jgi:hypothetical protein